MPTKTNLELKHFCSDFKNIRKVLKNLGAKKEIIKKQTDYFFHLSPVQERKSGRLKLRIEQNEKTLIYYERPAFASGKDTTSAVHLYKIKDTELLPFLTTSLGLKAIVEKQREVWRKDNTVFHLDTVKHVGKLVEVELQKDGKITPEDKATFASYQKQLQPFLGAVIKGSNIDLILKK